MITMNDEQILKLAIEADLIDARDIGGHKVCMLPDPYIAAIYKFAELAQKPLLDRIAELEQSLPKVTEANFDQLTPQQLRVWKGLEEAK